MKNRIIYIMFGAASILSACKANKATKGGVIGASGGAVVGGVVGKSAGNTALGAIIGATVGGTAGALIGRHMDKQAEELRRDLEGVDVERVGEGIKITFDSGLMFETDSYILNNESQENLDQLAAILKKYDDTNIVVEGHTDNTGSESYNEKLSLNRAQQVSSYLRSRDVSGSRLETIAFGESQPIADNSTSAGRKQNRRVEVAIFANNRMIKAAEKGEI